MACIRALLGPRHSGHRSPPHPIRPGQTDAGGSIRYRAAAFSNLRRRDAGGIRSQLLDLARERAVRIDAQVTASLKSTVALPGSLHASMMRPVASMGAGELALRVPEIARC